MVRWSQIALLQQTKNGQYVLTLPRNLVSALGWTKGQDLKISVAGKDRLELNAK